MCRSPAAAAAMERGVVVDGAGRPPPEASSSGVWLLCYFLYKHNDFRIAETQALAELAGFGDVIRWFVTLTPRPSCLQYIHREPVVLATIYCACRLVFLNPCALPQLTLRLRLPPSRRRRKPYGGREDSPFWYVFVPSIEKAKEMAKRSLLIKARGRSLHAPPRKTSAQKSLRPGERSR